MPRFEILDDFYLDGRKIKIISGAIHYFRVPQAYWRDRLVKLKNMGCNTVETYIPWNLHEPRKGRFDFSGRCDVEGFVRLAQELGLYVILRPSPYICAEWEFGGLPAWLLREDGIRLRCSDERFLAHVLDYYDELMKRLVPLQVTQGGAVLMMQVENEYGSFGDDRAYLAALRDGMRERGVEVPLFTADGPEHDMMHCGRVEGVFQMGNFGSHAKENFDYMQSLGIAPLMCMEFWCGWFDHWGNDGHSRTDPKACAEAFEALLQRGHVNIYMFHGGTSFGLMNGANDYDKLCPDVTSYDYDAPLTEDGQITEKYRLFQAAIERTLGAPIAQTALSPIPVRAYEAPTLLGTSSLLRQAKNLYAHHRAAPVSMERLAQDYGYTLYSTVLENEQSIRSLQLTEAADRAQIYVDGQWIATLYDRQMQSALTFQQEIPVRKGSCLDILVENMGRVNYSYKLEMQRKGIDGAVIINRHLHYGWDIRCLDEEAMAVLTAADPYAEEGPTVSRFSFRVDAGADTWLDMSGWGKGVVLLNGKALGRFWDVGPQRRLYIPAPLFQAGENTLTILETEGRRGTLCFADQPNLG